MTTTVPAERRSRTLALLMATPAVAAALLLTAVALWRLAQPDASLFSAPPPRSLAEAIQQNDARAEYRFLRDGQDPNALIAVTLETPHGDRPLTVSPLVWAVASNRREATLVLIAHGATLDRAMDRHAACLAAAVGNDELADVLRAQPRAAADACPPLAGDDVPLLAYLSQIGATE